MRVRIRYTKEGRVRFVSGRDLPSVWERALRRVDLPIAYSEGFHPHPKVSFPDALPVGVASTGEYAELTFAAPVDPGRSLAAVSATLPDGMRILTHRIVPDAAPKLAQLLQVTLWELLYPDPSGAVVDRLRRGAARLLDAGTVPIHKSSPRGDTREVDLRPAIVALHVEPAGPPAEAHLRAIFSHDGPTVRPTDLHEALLTTADPDEPPLPAPRLTRRVAQGKRVPEGLAEALSGDIVPLRPGPATPGASLPPTSDDRRGGPVAAAGSRAPGIAP